MSSIYASSSILRQPTPAQETADWTSTVGTWKIGKRNLVDELRVHNTPSGHTKLVSNFDPVSGRHHIGLFSVGRQGWRNQRKRSIAVNRELGEQKFVMKENAATPDSSVVFYGDAMSMEGRTILCTPTSVRTSPPHPSLKYSEKMKRLAPTELLPRRVQLQVKAARTQQNQEYQQDHVSDVVDVPLDQAASILRDLLVSSLENSWFMLNNALAGKPADGVSAMEFGNMLFDAHWKCGDDDMLALLRTYACDAGIDAALVVSDMMQCITRPGYCAARYPAAMRMVTTGLFHRLRNLESRFLKSDEDARENNKNVGMRARSERPGGHVDVQVFGEHLKRCGFHVEPRVMRRLQALYCCREGSWKGYLNYEPFLRGLSEASLLYVPSDTSIWNTNQTPLPDASRTLSVADVAGAQEAGRGGTAGAGRVVVNGVGWADGGGATAGGWVREDTRGGPVGGGRKCVSSWGGSMTRGGGGGGGGSRPKNTIDFWARPSTASDVVRYARK